MRRLIPQRVDSRGGERPSTGSGREPRRTSRFWPIAIGATVTFEALTILARVVAGRSAAEFIAASDPPVWIKMHHMFWAVPVALAAIVIRNGKWSIALWAIAAALVASDLIHHFVVLPLWVGNTGWHWP